MAAIPSLGAGSGAGAGVGTGTGVGGAGAGAAAASRSGDAVALEMEASEAHETAALPENGSGGAAAETEGLANPAANDGNPVSGCMTFCVEQVPSKLMSIDIAICLITIVGAIYWRSMGGGTDSANIIATIISIASCLNALGLALGLYGWRRYYQEGNLHQQTKKMLVQTQEKLASAISETKTITADITHATGALHSETDNLTAGVAALVKTTDEETKVAAEAGEVLEASSQTPEKLKAQNVELQKKIERMEACIKDLDSKLLKIQEQNNRFADYLKTLGVKTDDVGIKELEKAAGAADKTWDDNAARLQALVESIQKGLEALFAKFAEQHNQLRTELGRLKESVPQEKAIGDQMARSLAQLQLIQDKVKQEKEELARVSAQQDETKRQLEAVTRQLVEQTQKAQETSKEEEEEDNKFLDAAKFLMDTEADDKKRQAQLQALEAIAKDLAKSLKDKQEE